MCVMSLSRSSTDLHWRLMEAAEEAFLQKLVGSRCRRKSRSRLNSREAASDKPTSEEVDFQFDLLI